MFATVYGIAICIAGLAGILWIMWKIRHGDTDRHEEDAAREFFDRHGHWPDESPEEAQAERLRLSASPVAAPPVSQADPDGFV